MEFVLAAVEKWKQLLPIEALRYYTVVLYLLFNPYFSSQMSQIIRRILYEPLFHFLILAGLLFFVDALLSVDTKEQILVDRQTAQYVIKLREELELRPLSPEEKQAVVENYVADEILYRESYKRGLDKSDTRMRRNLILKMRGLITDEVKTPDYLLSTIAILKGHPGR